VPPVTTAPAMAITIPKRLSVRKVEFPWLHAGILTL
jgi:hypothetical protein